MIVWLASYPRSGNTFLRVLLNKNFNIQTYSIYDDRTDIGADKKTSNFVGHRFLPNNFDLSSARIEDKLYFIKTHELPNDCVNEGDKIIYLIRDGRESVFSFYQYMKNFGDSKVSIRDIIYGNVFFGGWGGHVESWRANKRGNTLLIKFEKLIDHPEKYISIISDFISVKSGEIDIPLFSELKAINPTFFNSGKKDSWKSVFSDSEHLAFWLKNYTQMMDFGYTDSMPDIIDNQSAIVLFNQFSVENSYLVNEFCNLKKQVKNNIQGIINSRDGKIREQEKRINEQEKRINDQEKKINEKNEKLVESEKVIAKLQNELELIHASKAYKAFSLYKKVRDNRNE